MIDEHCHHDENETISKYQQVFNQYGLDLHDEIVQEETKKLISRHFEENNTREIKKTIFGLIELTSLKATDNEDSILRLVEKVNRFSNENPEFPNIAGICVYPRFVEIVSNSLEADKVELVTVTGGFPASLTFPEVKTIETALALKDGATEIDTVLPVGLILNEDYEQASDEIQETKEICGEEHLLKVILETGALQTAVNIKKSALLAIYSGADFIKTSTGKIEPGSTPFAVYTMCKTIKEYYEKTGTKIGIKVAGGIKTPKQAVEYYTIVKEILGEDWLTPSLFRIGASSLANNLLSDITGEMVKFF